MPDCSQRPPDVVWLVVGSDCLHFLLHHVRPVNLAILWCRFSNLDILLLPPQFGVIFSSCMSKHSCVLAQTVWICLFMLSNLCLIILWSRILNFDVLYLLYQ